MQLKLSAIDVLTMQTIARREKSHFDAIIAGIKNAKNGARGVYGYNENFKSYLNGALDLEALKAAADALERDARTIKSAIVRHNSTAKVSFFDAVAGETREVSIFEAFNVLKDVESDMSRAHGEIVNNISITVHKDTPADEVAATFEDPSEYEELYHRTMATVFSLKTSIAKVNNKSIRVDIESDHLVAILGLTQA